MRHVRALHRRRRVLPQAEHAQHAQHGTATAFVVGRGTRPYRHWDAGRAAELEEGSCRDSCAAGAAVGKVQGDGWLITFVARVTVVFDRPCRVAHHTFHAPTKSQSKVIHVLLVSTQPTTRVTAYSGTQLPSHHPIGSDFGHHQRKRARPLCLGSGGHGQQ